MVEKNELLQQFFFVRKIKNYFKIEEHVIQIAYVITSLYN